MPDYYAQAKDHEMRHQGEERPCREKGCDNQGIVGESISAVVSVTFGITSEPIVTPGWICKDCIPS